MKTFIFLIITIPFLFCACSKNPAQDQSSQNDVCCISGRISLYNTGQTIDVDGALVQFFDYNTNALVWSKTIGGDGFYQTDKNFKNDGYYYQRILKVDHIDTLYYFNRKIQVTPSVNDKCTPIDWVIQAEAKTLWVVDINNPEQRIDTLNFDTNNIVQYFQIWNTGGIAFNWSIQKQNYNWIKSITPSDSGKLTPNQYINLELEIDRSKLSQGTTTSFLIDSDEGGGRVITVNIL